MLFGRSTAVPSSSIDESFSYLQTGNCYVDSACQTLRPTEVLDAQREYATHYPACGGRVKYEWGKRVDERVDAARAALLSFTNKSAKDYCVAFTLNTTYGINLVLQQLQVNAYRSIVTSEIEHNSVLLPCMAIAQKSGKSLHILPREETGALAVKDGVLDGAIAVLNSVSNIHAAPLVGMPALADTLHQSGGLLLIDAAQGFAHDVDALRKTDFDVAFGSGHKMNGPSVGFIIIRRTVLEQLDACWIGGGTVTDVDADGYTLLRSGPQAHALLEPGLQNWEGIVGMEAALAWHAKHPRAHERIDALANLLFAELSTMPRVHLLSTVPTPILSFHVDGIDAHDLSLYLSKAGVMCRSGYFCCHRYLQHQRGLPPLLRISLGLHNTQADADQLLSSLRTILSTF